MKVFVTVTKSCSHLIVSCVGLPTSLFTDILNELSNEPHLCV
jgi:hypothetical protein